MTTAPHGGEQEAQHRHREPGDQVVDGKARGNGPETDHPRRDGEPEAREHSETVDRLRGRGLRDPVEARSQLGQLDTALAKDRRTYTPQQAATRDRLG